MDPSGRCGSHIEWKSERVKEVVKGVKFFSTPKAPYGKEG
jgi:hypothetical protein